jgi:hypothetical protein
LVEVAHSPIRQTVEIVESAAGVVDPFPRAPNQVAQLTARRRVGDAPTANVDQRAVVKDDDDITIFDGKAAMSARTDRLAVAPLPPIHKAHSVA